MKPPLQICILCFENNTGFLSPHIHLMRQGQKEREAEEERGTKVENGKRRERQRERKGRVERGKGREREE